MDKTMENKIKLMKESKIDGILIMKDIRGGYLCVDTLHTEEPAMSHFEELQDVFAWLSGAAMTAIAGFNQKHPIVKRINKECESIKDALQKQMCSDIDSALASGFKHFLYHEVFFYLNELFPGMLEKNDAWDEESAKFRRDIIDFYELFPIQKNGIEYITDVLLDQEMSEVTMGAVNDAIYRYIYSYYIDLDDMYAYHLVSPDGVYDEDRGVLEYEFDVRDSRLAEYGNKPDEYRAYTIIAEGDGPYIIERGFHVVNRVGYLIEKRIKEYMIQIIDADGRTNKRVFAYNESEAVEKILGSDKSKTYRIREIIGGEKP